MKYLSVIFLFISLSLKAQWTELGGLNSLLPNSDIKSIATDKFNNVYVGGYFTNPTTGYQYVAKYDGINWSELGGPKSFITQYGGILSIITDSSGNVYASEGVRITDSVNIRGYKFVGKYDGNSWKELTGTDTMKFNDFIAKLAIDKKQNIYAVGNFTNANGKTYVAKWDGINWTELGGKNGSTFNAQISNVTVDLAGNVYVSGYFTNSSGNYYVAKWDGNSWSEPGGLNSLKSFGSNQPLLALTSVKKGNVYSSGPYYKDFWGNFYEYVYEYNGTQWSRLGQKDSLNANNLIQVLTTDQSDNIYAAGNFTGKYGVSYVAVYHDSAWIELGDGSVKSNNVIDVISFDKSGSIYASTFLNSSGNKYVAKYTVGNPVIKSFSPLMAKKGTVITIKGQGFLTAKSVSLGLTKYNITAYSDTLISFVVGSGASGDVTVTTIFGTGSLSGFTYVNNPVISSFYPTVAKKGKIVTIKGNYFNSATVVQFGNAPAASFIVLNDSTIQAIVGDGASGNISVTNLSGSISLPGFIYCNTPYLTLMATANGIVPFTSDTFTLSHISNSYTPQYIWTLNGNKVSTNNRDSVYITNTIGDGNVISVMMIDSSYCGMDTVFSNKIYMYVSSSVITTIAGTGVQGFSGDNSQAIQANLYNPGSLCVDKWNNIYFVDNGNNRIRKIDTAGIITTIAGTGSTTYNGDGGAAIAANLNIPKGIAVDTAGNILIADSYNNRIRKIDKYGIISTIAGIGTSGYSGDGGQASAAKLNRPVRIVIDSKGNLYIPDKNSHRIRKIDVTGIITTIAGTGGNGYNGDSILATSATLSGPTDVAIDTAGNLYIADQSNYRIRKVDKNNIITTVSYAVYPQSVAVDISGNVYYGDSTNRIWSINSQGYKYIVAGNSKYNQGYSGDNKYALDAELNFPRGIAFNNAGNMFIADFNNNCIRKIKGNLNAHRVAGFTKNLFGGSINNFMLYVKDSVSTAIYHSNSNGYYNCTVNSGTVVIHPTKNNDINKSNGVTTLDLALTQSHILGKNKLNKPYKIIAADVNGDGKVTTLDLVYMKRLILGIDTTFTNSNTKENMLWAFVDSSYQFPDTTNPFPFKDSISYIGLSANKSNQSFIGVKLGDVNWDWNPLLAKTPSKVFVKPKKISINE